MEHAWKDRGQAVEHTVVGAWTLAGTVGIKSDAESDVRADFKLETLPNHLLMNLVVVDEHGRQLGMGRHLAALKAELGAMLSAVADVGAGDLTDADNPEGATI